MVAAAAAPAAPAAPLRAHFGTPSLGSPNDLAGIDAAVGTDFSKGIVSKQAGCQVKGLGGFAASLPSAAPGFPNSSIHFYVVRPTGSTATACPPILVADPVAPSGTKNLNFLQWEKTPGAASYDIYRTDGVAPPSSAGLVATVNTGTACPDNNSVANDGNNGGLYHALRCSFTDPNTTAPGAAVGNVFALNQTQAGSHPDFRITQRMDYGGVDNTPIGDTRTPLTGGDEPFSCDGGSPPTIAGCATVPGTNEAIRTDLFHFADGLVANPRSTLDTAGAPQVCARTGPNSLLGDPNLQGSQDPNEDTCPLSTKVGTVQTITRVPNAASPGNTRLSITFGDLYNAAREGTEAARLFVVLRPACSAGAPSPFNPQGAVCQSLLPCPNPTANPTPPATPCFDPSNNGQNAANASHDPGREVKKEFQAGVATIVPTPGANGQYHIDVNIVDEITGGDIENFQQVLVHATPGNNASAFTEPTNIRIPRQVRVIQQDLFGYGSTALNVAPGVSHDNPATDRPNVTLPTSCQNNLMVADKTEFDDPNTVATTPNTEGLFLTNGCQNVPNDYGLVSEVDTNQAEAPVANGTTVAVCPDPEVKNCPAGANNQVIHESHIHTVTALFPKGLVVNAAAGNDIKDLGAVIGDVAGNSEELGPLGGDIKLIRVNDDGTFVIQAEVRPVDTPEQVIPLEFVVTPDPQTGQLRAEDDNAPQLPFTALQLRLGGQGIPKTLVNPPTSGQNVTDVELGPWSGNPVVGVDDSFETVGGPTATAASVRAQAADDRPFSPTVTGTVDPSTANQDGNLALHIEKQDRQQNLKGFSLHLPNGLLTNLGALTLCPAAQADTADCPAASQIGTVDIGSGNGPNPLHLPGQVFITEPLVSGDVAGMVVKVVATVGPFRLGTVIQKSRLILDASRLGVDVQTVGEFPTILKGFPVRIRSIDLNINGLRNPVTCNPGQFAATFESQGDPTTSRTAQEGGAKADSSAPYAATGCENLPFSPKLASVIGSNSQPAAVNSHPPVSTVVTQPDHEAAISSSTVSLPVGLNANIAALGNTCSRDQLNANACPAASKVGDAAATSPLIPAPLTGPMYLVENTGGLPKLVVKLSGLIDQQLEASSSLVNNRVVTTFTGLPATPVTRFELNVAGGPNGLFTVGNELCAPRTIDGTFNSHTGQVATVSSPAQVVGNCVPVNAAATSRRPRLSVRVTGVRRSPTIRIVARKATEGSANLSTLRVVLPGQISVRNTRRGITVTAGGKRLATRNWSLSRSRVLTIRGLPKFGRSIITATIRSSAIRAGRSLRSRALRGRTLPSVTFSSRIVDITNARYTFRTRVRPGR